MHPTGRSQEDRSFLLRLANYVEDGKVAKDGKVANRELQMVKLYDDGEKATNHVKHKEREKFVFMADSGAEASEWMAAIRAYTLDELPASGTSGAAATSPAPPAPPPTSVAEAGSSAPGGGAEGTRARRVSSSRAVVSSSLSTRKATYEVTKSDALKMLERKYAG